MFFYMSDRSECKQWSESLSLILIFFLFPEKVKFPVLNSGVACYNNINIKAAVFTTVL